MTEVQTVLYGALCILVPRRVPGMNKSVKLVVGLGSHHDPPLSGVLLELGDNATDGSILL